MAKLSNIESEVLRALMGISANVKDASTESARDFGIQEISAQLPNRRGFSDLELFKALESLKRKEFVRRSFATDSKYVITAKGIDRAREVV